MTRWNFSCILKCIPDVGNESKILRVTRRLNYRKLLQYTLFKYGLNTHYFCK